MALILYAEDDELVGESVRHTLSQAGHIVGLVDNGLAALDAMKAKRPALVILDCAMPELPGVDVLRRMRADPELYELPVLMLTARKSLADVNLAMRAGATDYLKKPFDPDQLVVLVDALLENRAVRARSAG